MSVPTIILDLDFARLPSEITGLETYDQAFILVRLYGRPVGQTVWPVIDGYIDGSELRDHLIKSVDWPLLKSLLDVYLGKELTSKSNSSLTATVAVCTRNRPEDLRRCLERLVQLPNDGQEFLVIDSCSSTDETRRVVEDFDCIRYIREDRPGLNIARNRALCEAQGEIVAFIDDDAVPDPNWLRALLDNFDDPTILCVTGLTMPLELETKAQEWFEHYSPFGRGFDRRVFDKNILHPLAAGHVGAGVNMAFRRCVLEKIGSFDETLDAGTPTLSGGDYEMFSRILAAGYQIVYDPAALSWHRHRRTWRELRQTVYGYGVGVYAAWTRSILVEREISALAIAWCWFRNKQLPTLLGSLMRRSNHTPLDLILAELWGCLVGPWVYLFNRNRSYTGRYDDDGYDISKCSYSDPQPKSLTQTNAR